MRDLFKALTELEANLENSYGISMNEAMVLCCIGDIELTSSAISKNTGMLAPHTSKTIRSVEKKELVKRSLGKLDKRQMYFKLTAKGYELVSRLKREGIVIPKLLESLF